MDKEYSLTDCLSMRIMEQRGIEEVLTADQHFAQAGFRPLLA
jgi:predicted nucleic acid-binding protein